MALLLENEKVTTVPRFVSFKCYNGKYLQFVKEDGELHGYLQASGDEVVSPYTKFEIEPSVFEEGKLTIKSCYNNKYWKLEPNDEWIVATASDDEDGQPFKLWYVNKDAKTVRLGAHYLFAHYYLTVTTSSPSHSSCLKACFSTAKTDVLTIVDWEYSLAVLPKHIAFKGHNGKYLVPDSKSFMYSGEDADLLSTPEAWHEVFAKADGTVSIKNMKSGLFWKRYYTFWEVTHLDDDYIYCDHSNDKDLDTMFNPVKVDNGYALRNLGNTYYCNEVNKYLKAESSATQESSCLKVEEAVLLREIYDVCWHKTDKTIYNNDKVTLDTRTLFNDKQKCEFDTVVFSYTNSTSSTWNFSVQPKFGVETNIDASIPLIENTEIKTGVKFSGPIQLGKTETAETPIESTPMVAVPPMTIVRMCLVADVASFDMPFSYSQCDTLCNGQKVFYDMDDGIYTGTNLFNIRLEIAEERPIV